ncbi:hypothetical protein LX36DRAFT_107457 [Colletotrichum falcatum]|nr:hypothetical protein LX36DRAFT_107457 [Colletotrichum falcatum]
MTRGPADEKREGLEVLSKGQQHFGPDPEPTRKGEGERGFQKIKKSAFFSPFFFFSCCCRMNPHAHAPRARACQRANTTQVVDDAPPPRRILSVSGFSRPHRVFLVGAAPSQDSLRLLLSVYPSSIHPLPPRIFLALSRPQSATLPPPPPLSIVHFFTS